MDGSVANKLEIVPSQSLFACISVTVRGTEVFPAGRINSTHVMQGVRSSYPPRMITIILRSEN